MKTYFFALMLSLSFVASYGQRTIRLKSDVAGKTTAQALADTVVNAAVKTQSSTPIVDAYNAIGVQVTVTKISGTAAGVVRLFGSIDGVNYTRIAPTDSLNVANVTTSAKLFDVLPAGKVWPWAYIRASYTGSGTMSASFITSALIKK